MTLENNDFLIFFCLLQAFNNAAAFGNLMSVSVLSHKSPKVPEVFEFLKLWANAGFDGYSFVIVEGHEFCLACIHFEAHFFQLTSLPIAGVLESITFLGQLSCSYSFLESKTPLFLMASLSA